MPTWVSVSVLDLNQNSGFGRTLHWTTLEKGASLRKKKRMKVSKVGLFLFTRKFPLCCLFWSSTKAYATWVFQMGHILVCNRSDLQRKTKINGYFH